MARLPYVPEDIAQPAALVAEFRARHDGRLLEVERMMLHSPALAGAWNGFFGGIKRGMLLSALHREMVACAVGSLNGAPYQHRQHAAPFLAAGGSAAQLEALRQPLDAADDAVLFSPLDRAVLSVATEMTRDVRVREATFAAACAALGNHQAMVELVGVVAGYNLVSRFLVALEVGGPEA